MRERHAHKKFPAVHILNLEGVLLDPKEDTTRVAIGRDPIPSKLVATKAF
jgi:hypothetical protein